MYISVPLLFANIILIKTVLICEIHKAKKINVLGPETSEYFLGSVGRQKILF